MKASDLEGLTRVDEKTAALVQVDPKTVNLARDAARTFGAVDKKLIASLAQSMSGLDRMKLIDVSAMREAAKAFESVRIMDSARLAEALREVNTANVTRFAEAMKGLQFVPSLQPRMLEALRALEVPPTLSRQIAQALKDLPRVTVADLAPTAAEVVRQAVVLAESPTVTDVVDETLVDLPRLSAADCRELQKEVVDAIATIGTLVAVFLRDDRIEVASGCLALVAILVSIYWRLTGNRGE